MNPQDIAFGIELETTIPTSDNTSVGPYHHGYAVPYLPTGWKVESDSSIHTSPGRRGAEYVSPVLRGSAGIGSVKTAVEILNARGARVNPTCGIHITVTWNGDAAALARLITLFANHEKAFYAQTGTPRREAGLWAKGLKQYQAEDTAKNRAESDRYHAMNLTHLANGQNRIEFRVFAGSLNADKIIGHILAILALVALAQQTSRRSKWNYTPKAGTKPAWARKGLGQTELARLFYKLGWIKGHRSEALAADLVSPEQFKASKKKLTAMAKKYDGRANS